MSSYKVNLHSIIMLVLNVFVLILTTQNLFVAGDSYWTTYCDTHWTDYICQPFPNTRAGRSQTGRTWQINRGGYDGLFPLPRVGRSIHEVHQEDVQNDGSNDVWLQNANFLKQRFDDSINKADPWTILALKYSKTSRPMEKSF